MLHLLARLLPDHVVHDLGSGRALDNARRERDEIARTTAIIDQLAGRLEPAVPERVVPELVVPELVVPELVVPERAATALA